MADGLTESEGSEQNHHLNSKAFRSLIGLESIGVTKTNLFTFLPCLSVKVLEERMFCVK